MTPAARVSAAIEVLGDIEARRRPASEALKDWGLARRFAGSKDRAAIASLVYDALRRKASAAWIMGSDAPRAVLIGTLSLQRGLAAEAIASLFSGERFAPEPLSESERGRLAEATLEGAPDWVAGDFPEWIAPSLRQSFGEDLVPELQGLAARAPLDVRVNALKVGREEVRAAMPHLGADPTPHSPWGLRIPHAEDGRGPSLQAEPEFLQGWFEIQDEGSQVAALLTRASPGETVVDLCAGGGGKTLALAAITRNEGRLIATDSDLRRLAPIHDRLRRAGVSNVEVSTPRGRNDPLVDLDGAIDCVLVDAPCTGSGTWRRNPDAKWRLRPGSLSSRQKEQGTTLDRAAALVRPCGRIVYVTCSILPEENDGAVANLLEREPALRAAGPEDVLASAEVGPDFRASVRPTRFGIQMTPRRTGTDGFYVAILRRVV